MGSAASSQNHFYVANGTSEPVQVSASSRQELAHLNEAVRAKISEAATEHDSHHHADHDDDKHAKPAKPVKKIIKKQVLDNYRFVTVPAKTTREFRGGCVTVVDSRWNLVCSQTSVKNGQSVIIVPSVARVVMSSPIKDKVDDENVWIGQDGNDYSTNEFYVCNASKHKVKVKASGSREIGWLPIESGHMFKFNGLSVEIKGKEIDTKYKVPVGRSVIVTPGSGVQTSYPLKSSDDKKKAWLADDGTSQGKDFSSHASSHDEEHERNTVVSKVLGHVTKPIITNLNSKFEPKKDKEQKDGHKK